ncbi:GA2OX2, partial [Symbiodinium pilosum]
MCLKAFSLLSTPRACLLADLFISRVQGAESVSKTETTDPGSEVAGSKKARPSDRVESMIYFGHGSDVIPKAVPEYAEVMERYRKEVFRLLLASMALTAASLDLPLGHFEPFFTEKNLSANENTVRLAYYPAYKEGEEPLPGQLRYGEHTDYTGFTFLWQDHNASGPQTAATNIDPPPGGLQVRMPDGSWVDCPPKPKAFTINAGDLIQAWTNDVFLSNSHRVVNPPPGARDRHDRISIVFFTGPANDTIVEPLPSPQRLAAGDGEPSKLSLDVDAKECEEIAAICRHLDLRIEVLPAPPGSAASKRVTATRTEDLFEEAEPEQAKVEPRPAEVSGKVRLEERFGRKPPKAAVEAETLLEKSQLPKLTDFYRALVDAYPGFHVPLAKLLTLNLRAAGVSG